MSNIKKKVYKTVLKEIFKKCEGVEDFINKKLEEICSYEKLSIKEVIASYASLLSL